MRSIGGIVGLLVVALIVAMTYKYYFLQGSSAGVTTPRQTIDVVGVKNDLVAIGQAERIYQAQHDSYASLDDLVSSGAMSMKKTGRDGYTYDAEASTDSFRVTAHCPADTVPGCVSYAIDQTMEVQTAP
jgi:hypothetical protein